jgi:hypothetical protein
MPRTEQFAVGAALIASALAGILRTEFLAYFVLVVGVGFIADIYVRDAIWGTDRPTWEQIQKISATDYKEKLTKSRRFERWVNHIDPERAKKREETMIWVLPILAVVIFTGVFLFLRSFHSGYEVIERTEKEMPNFQKDGTHKAIQYVLRHDDRKIYATCDLKDYDQIAPDARCSFRPLRTYTCTLSDDRISKATFPLNDLKCKDSEGYSVYLYVDKEE